MKMVLIWPHLTQSIRYNCHFNGFPLIKCTSSHFFFFGTKGCKFPFLTHIPVFHFDNNLEIWKCSTLCTSQLLLQLRLLLSTDVYVVLKKVNSS